MEAALKGFPKILTVMYITALLGRVAWCLKCMPLNIQYTQLLSRQLSSQLYVNFYHLVWRYKREKEQVAALTCQLFTKSNKDFLSSSRALILYALKAAVTSDFKATVSAEVFSVQRERWVSQLLTAPPLAQMQKCWQVSGPETRQRQIKHFARRITWLVSRNTSHICCAIISSHSVDYNKSQLLLTDLPVQPCHVISITPSSTMLYI